MWGDEPYRLLFQRNPHPMWILDQETLAFLAVNDAAVHHYGYSRDEFLAMTIADIQPPAERLALQAYQAAIRSQHEALTLQSAGVWKHCKKDGTILHAEITWSPLRFNGRNAVGVVATNVTAHKQAEEALLSKTEQLQAITEAMTTFLEQRNWRDASGRLLRRALQQTQSEYGFIGVIVEGPALRVLAHEGMLWDQTVNREFYERAVRTYHEVGYLEFRNLENLFGKVITEKQVVLSNDPGSDPRSGGLPSGHPPLRHFLGVPIYHGQEVMGMIGMANRPGGYTGIEQAKLEVLTQAAGVLYDSYRRQQRERQLEEQLRQAQKMEAIGRLASGIAHDFNNMLTVMTGYSHLLLARLPRMDANRKDLEEIIKAGSRAAALTNQLLIFSRRQVLHPKILDLNTIVSDLNGMLQRLIGEDIHLITIQAPELGKINADPGQIEQVILNLVVNARDAMPQGGQVTIETANVALDQSRPDQEGVVRPGAYVMLRVRDSGAGMDPETVAHIFEPFFTTKEIGKGIGLGLATVYGIVKQSGGHICVDSAVGKGSTFTLYFPLVEGDINKREEENLSLGTCSGTETILLVEDDPAVRSLARASLEAAGYTVLMACEGQEAVEVCRRHQGPIHLLVSDVVMPGINGRQLADSVRAVRPALKVLLMSGYTDEAMMRHGVFEANVPFLQKPFTPTALAQKVREALGIRESRDGFPRG